MSESYTHLFIAPNGRAEELLAVAQLPDRDPAVYALGDGFNGAYTFFRYDDGWRQMPRPGATVDYQRLMIHDEDWAEISYELGVEPGLIIQLLEEAKARPWPDPTT